MKTLIISACLLAVAYSFSTPDTRSAGNETTVSLVTDINALLDKAKKGIQSDDLEEEAEKIAIAAEEFLEEDRGTVNDEDVESLIDDVASEFEGEESVSALFGEDPLEYEEESLEVALKLLDGLAEKAQELSDEDEPLKNVVAAIARTAESIVEITQDTEGISVVYEGSQTGEEEDEDNEEEEEEEETRDLTPSYGEDLPDDVDMGRR